MMAGVYYFEENDVGQLLETFKMKFKQSTVLFDDRSSKGIQIANKKVIDEGGMDKTAYLKWGTDNIYEIEQWNTGIQVEKTMKMFTDHRKRYPRSKRIGMWISDTLSIMSLAKIAIE